MLSIEERQKKLEQKKQKLKAQEQKLKLQMRKQRTQRLIELGGLISKAGLDDLPSNVFYGALLHVKNNLAEHKNAWELAGGKAFNNDKKSA